MQWSFVAGVPAALFLVEPRLAAFQVLEAEFVVFLELADLFLHLQELEAHFLDTPVERADLFLELPDTSDVAATGP